MITCVLISNDLDHGNEIKVKGLTKDNIYKKCNFKTSDNFELINSWNYKDNVIELWGKNKGKEKFKINKISNIDESLYTNNKEIYNKAIFLMHNNNEYCNFSLDTLDKFISETIIIETMNNNIENNIQENNIQENNIQENNIENKEIHENMTKEINEDNNSEYSYDSELSYELYCYSSDED